MSKVRFHCNRPFSDCFVVNQWEILYLCCLEVRSGTASFAFVTMSEVDDAQYLVNGSNKILVCGVFPDIAFDNTDYRNELFVSSFPMVREY